RSGHPRRPHVRHALVCGRALHPRQRRDARRGGGQRTARELGRPAVHDHHARGAQLRLDPLPDPGRQHLRGHALRVGAGGEIATEDGGSWTAAINQPEAVEGLEWYTDLALEHDSSTSAANTWLETDTPAEFLQETVPMFITGSWVPATIRADNPELADKLVAFTLPAKDSAVAP